MGPSTKLCVSRAARFETYTLTERRLRLWCCIVEENADLAAWPYSRIRLLSLLGLSSSSPLNLPLSLISVSNCSVEPIEQSDQPVEAATGAIEANPQLIVASLRAELEKERVSHTQTHKQAEAEILSLRAQLAQREAELEACETHKDHAALLASSLGAEAPTSSPREVEADGVSATPLTSQAVMEILAIRAAKNRELETEIKNLTSKVRTTIASLPRP